MHANNNPNAKPSIFEGILIKIEMICVGLNMATVFAMMLIVVYGVVARYVLNMSVSWVVEISEFMMVSLSFLTLCYVQSKKKHLNITVLIDKQSIKTKTLLRIMTTIFSLGLFLLLTWASWKFALKALHAGFVSDSAEIPLFPFRLLVPTGSFLMCIRLAVDLLQDIGSLTD